MLGWQPFFQIAKGICQFGKSEAAYFNCVTLLRECGSLNSATVEISLRAALAPLLLPGDPASRKPQAATGVFFAARLLFSEI